MSNRPTVTMYTDGGAKPNPGRGAYAAILFTTIVDDGPQRTRTREVVGTDEGPVTNNQMELMAAIAGLEQLIAPTAVTIWSDSQWFVNCARGEWVRSSNKNLWQRYDRAAAGHRVRPRWVRGHDGNSFNERAHQLVSQALADPAVPSSNVETTT